MPGVWGEAAVFTGGMDCVSVSTESECRQLLTGCDLIQRLTKKKRKYSIYLD